MKTLLSCSNPPLIHLPNPTPLKPTTSSIQPRETRSQNPKLFLRKSRLVQANGKGFPGGSTSIDEPKKMKSSTGKNDGDDGDEKISDEVFNRIIVRILTFSGVPMMSGMVLLKVFEIVKNQGVDFPLWIPYLTIFVFFGASTMGLAYGPLSASLDLEKKGSILGLEEAQKNWVEMWKEEEQENQ